MENIDYDNARVATLAAELGPTSAFFVSRRMVDRSPPRIPHRHEFFEVFWIVDGTCQHFINRETEQLTPGRIFFIRPDDTHAFQNIDPAPCRMVNVAFAQTTADFLQNRYGAEFQDRFFWSEDVMPWSQHLDPARLIELARLESALDRGERSLARIEAFLLKLLSDLVVVDAALPISAPDWLLQACETMRSPEALQAGVDFLVQSSCRSHEHVARTFRRHFNQTPSSWVNGMRISQAARMLMDSDDPILDIALACGIEDLSYFYRLFRQAHGMSPRKYRRQYQMDLVHPFTSNEPS